MHVPKFCISDYSKYWKLEKPNRLYNPLPERLHLQDQLEYVSQPLPENNLQRIGIAQFSFNISFSLFCFYFDKFLTLQSSQLWNSWTRQIFRVVDYSKFQKRNIEINIITQPQTKQCKHVNHRKQNISIFGLPFSIIEKYSCSFICSS